MMRKIALFAACLLFLMDVGAQKRPVTVSPEHLQAVKVTTMARVQYDSADFSASNQFQRPDTLWRFFECQNDTGVVGYVLEPKNPSYAVFWGGVGKEDSDFKAGVAEVQLAEALLARTLDLLADTAQNIQRALTAPRFYQYVRQYLFFINHEGDTCVHVNFIMQYGRTVFPDRRYLEQCDGDDTYWKADLNLTKARLTDYYVNGPTIYFVNGRSKVPQGLYRNTFFNEHYYLTEKEISFEQLPSALQAVAMQFDTSKIETFRRFSPYYWKYRQNRDGSITNIRKKQKPGSFYRVYTDSLCYGFDAKGRLRYVGHWDEWEGRLTSEALNHFSGIDKMLAAVNQDMTERGRNFPKYGFVNWIERVEEYYVLSVYYFGPVRADHLRLYYTFDKSGSLIGIGGLDY
jgi:hypothetical protein